MIDLSILISPDSADCDVQNTTLMIGDLDSCRGHYLQKLVNEQAHPILNAVPSSSCDEVVLYEKWTFCRFDFVA